MKHIGETQEHWGQGGSETPTVLSGDSDVIATPKEF